VCHGIPDRAEVLKDGDIINIDVAVIKDGYFGDTSRMYTVGEPSTVAQQLIDTTYEAMLAGIRQVKPGATLGDVGHAIQQIAQREGFSIVRDYCGHGIGKVYHEDPQVLHYGQPGQGVRLKPGMVFTIEPMINAGRAGTSVMRDGWTVVTKDRSLSAQWEHMVAVTDDGYELLTPWPRSAAACPSDLQANGAESVRGHSRTMRRETPGLACAGFVAACQPMRAGSHCAELKI
jgi:methionyl aminopeptidase